MAPPLQRIDHIHVFVRDRDAATRWYAEVLGMTPVAELMQWAADGGPLTVADASGAVHLALFERAPQPNRVTVALAVDADALVLWHAHLSRSLGKAPTVEDHELSVSLYFSDADGNPFEITTEQHQQARRMLLA